MMTENTLINKKDDTTAKETENKTNKNTGTTRIAQGPMKQKTGNTRNGKQKTR